jgi:hypothetical protein
MSIISRSISLIEALILADSGIIGLIFIKEYSIYKFAEDKIENKMECKKQIILKCKSVYTTNMMERYFMYIVIQILNYGLSRIMPKALGLFESSYVLFIMCMTISLPWIQNRIVNIKKAKEVIKVFNEDKEVFLKYTLSKLIINCIKELDEGVQDIKNYNIFLIYNVISLENVYDLAKSYTFVFVMNMLRKAEETYYYYKAIKLAYYYKSGYLFNVMPIKEAVYIVNMIIREKRWEEVSNVEVIHAVHVLINNKLQKDSESVEIQLAILKFFMIWTIISILKIFSIEVNTVLFAINMIINRKMIGTVIVVYMMIICNTNDILIGIILIAYKPLNYVLHEIYFYMKNKKDIKKVLKVYGKKIR